MSDSSESWGEAHFRAMGKKGRPSTKPKRLEEIPGQAERLRRLREAYDFPTTAAFARFLDIPLSTYNAFENGWALSRPTIFKICQRVAGVTSDWLYFDKADGLPFEVRRRLGLLEPPGGSRKS